MCLYVYKLLDSVSWKYKIYIYTYMAIWVQVRHNGLRLPDLTIKRINSERNKDMAIAYGFIYTLNRFANGIEYWVYEKRSFKARLHVSSNDIIQQQNSSEIIVNILIALTFLR